MAIGVNARTAFSLLFPPILDEFGWDRGIAAGAFSFGFFVSALLSPFVGRLMDRKGPRVVIETGVADASAPACGSRALRARAVADLRDARRAGRRRRQSASATACQSLFLPNWFVRRRGLAIGIAFSGVGIGSIVLLPWMQIADRARRLALGLPRARADHRRAADSAQPAAAQAPAGHRAASGRRRGADAASLRRARQQRRRYRVGVGRLDARARDAHRALLVDRARLLLRSLRLVRRAGAPDQVSGRDRRLADAGRVGARHRQPRRRPGADRASATCRTASAANGRGRSAASAS